MSKNYDNWEKLVGAVLLRDQLLRLALINSSDSSNINSASSSFNHGSASPFSSYDEHVIISNGETLLPRNYLGDWEVDLTELVFSESTPKSSRVSSRSLILWHAHQNDAAAVSKLLEEDRSLVHARDYDNRTPLHVVAIHGWIDIAKCLLEYEADVNAQDRWKNTPLADAEGTKKYEVIELLKSYGGLSYGQNGSHFEPRPVPPPLPNKRNWEIDPAELDFSESTLISRGSSGEIIKARWWGTPVAVKRIIPNLSDDRLVIQDFRHEVNLLLKLRHPNIVEFLGAVTEKKPFMLITEYLRGGDLHQHLKEKKALNPSTAINFALDIARGMAYLHLEPNVVLHRDLQPMLVAFVLGMFFLPTQMQIV